MKKYCLATFLFAMLMSMPMFAYDFVQNGIYYNIEGDHVSVTYSGNGVYSGSVSIPSQVTYNDVTYPVTAIGEWAFEGGEGITYLYIPSSITSIGEYAFIDCGSNINVYISDLKAWCKVTFGNVHSSPLSSAKKFYLSSSEVKQLVIPEGVEAIPNFAFYQCRSITSLYISGSVKSIGSSAFEDCTGLKWVCLSEGVESIGGSSFEGCTNLSTIIFPSTLSSIALNAFKNCSNLNTIFSRIQEPFAFVDNVFSTYSTATVTVPEGTTTAYRSTDGWNLFDNITDDSSQDPTKRTIHVATAGTLPNLISADEKYQIEELTLTGELNGTDFKLIRDMAGVSFKFKNYQGAYYPETNGILWSLDLSNAKIVSGGEGYVIADEGSPYYNKTRTMSIEDYNSKYTKNDCISTLLFFRTKLKSIILPRNVTTIGDGAFKDCSVLTSIDIPNNVTSIGWCAFEGCKALTSIIVESGNQYYDSRNDCNAIIEKSSNTLIAGCKNTIIPNSATSIGDYAFSGCSGLTSVTIPNSVKAIGRSAFTGCSGLTTVHIADLEAWCKITFSGSCFSTPYHFYFNGEEIKDLTIPNDITSIGNYTFHNCDLISVAIPNSVTSIGSSAFSGCSGLTSVAIGNSVNSIGSSAFYGCRGLTSVTIPNSVTSIGQYAFEECSGLTTVHIADLEAWCKITFSGSCFSTPYHFYFNGEEIKDLTIPNDITSIGNYTFHNCDLISVAIPNSVTSIGSSAFSGCSGLTSVVIGNSVNSIGGSAFSGCSGLTSVAIGNSVNSIGSSAFSGCSGLTSVTIPNSVTSIGQSAFYDCSGLTSVTIGNSVTSIGQSAFYDCSGLTSILSLNDTPPTCDISYSWQYIFKNVDKENCLVWVPKGCVTAYREANRWGEFKNFKEIVDGDVNLDEKVNRNDQNVLVGHIMGEKSERFYEGLADLNGDDDVNAADVVKLVDILNNGGLSTVTEFGYDNVDGSLVVSSLTCTLNNGRDETILLTKCELYSNGSLLRTMSFSSNPVSVAAGGKKSCTFENLSKPVKSTDFTVCWHYTVNGEAFVYRCPLTD